MTDDFWGTARRQHGKSFVGVRNREKDCTGVGRIQEQSFKGRELLVSKSNREKRYIITVILGGEWGNLEGGGVVSEWEKEER